MNDPIIGLDLWGLFVAACNVFILYSVLKKLLFETVKSVIDARENEVTTLFNEAEKAKTEAYDLKNHYDRSIENAKDKATEILQEATQVATKRSDAILEQASAEAQTLKQKAEASIEQERKKVVSELRSDISDLVIQAASKVIEKEITADDHKQLILNFVENEGE